MSDQNGATYTRSKQKSVRVTLRRCSMAAISFTISNVAAYADTAVTLVQAGSDGVDQQAAKHAISQAYPGLFTISGNTLTWTDGTAMLWDDGKERSAKELIESPDIEDMFHYVYPKADVGDKIPGVDFDPGRVRNEAFFEKLYGANSKAVSRTLVRVNWLPKLKGGAVQVSSKFGISESLTKISGALEEMPPGLSSFGLRPGGGFNWRAIAGTNQMSSHSFGSAFDMKPDFNYYWRSHMNEIGGRLIYRSNTPLPIVALFEKYGFIWGGRWYHYDSMHFEYRPELLLYQAAEK